MAFMHQKKDFIIEGRSVDIMFEFNHGIKVNSEGYCNEFCEKFGESIKCPIKMNKKKVHSNSITFYVSCIINCDIKYSLKCYKADIVQGENLKFEVMCNVKSQCEHGSTIEGRQLKGNARKDAQQKLLNKTPKQIRNDAIACLNKEQCEAGNMTSVHPLRVYQKARSEALGRNDFSKESVSDLQQRAMMERKNSEIFIQQITSLPFSVILFCEENLKILHESAKTDKQIQGYLDATGGVVRRISESNLLNHCLVFPIKSNAVNKNYSVLVLAELITEDNCSFNIENFLRLVKTKYQLLFKNEKMFRSIVTDKSYANINAIIQSQNRTSLLEYLEKIYAMRLDRAELKEITFVYLCSSHLAKVWKSDIEKYFKHLDKEDIYFLCSLIGNAVNIRRYEDLQSYLQNLIKFFHCKKSDSEYEIILQRMKEAISDDDDWIFHIDSGANAEQEREVIQSNKNSSRDSAKALYKQSPFFMEFNQYLENLTLEEEDECDELNVFYSPEFIKHFLKNSIAILPLWSAVFFSNGFNAGDQARRPNNGFVEGYFSSLKNSFRTNLSWGKLGTIKIGRYVEAMKENNQILLNEIKLKIPNKHIARKQKESDPTLASLPAEREQWRGKTKKSSTVMYSRESLIKKLSKMSN